MVRRRRERRAFTFTFEAFHRLRKRYTALLREEVSRTLSDPADIDEEIHALCEALIPSEGRLGP